MKKITFLIAFISCILAGNAQTGPTKTWVTMPPTTITLTEAFDLASNYDAGDDGAGTDYTVVPNYQYTLQIKKGAGGWTWVTGKSDASVHDTHTGSSSVSMTIPNTVALSSELPAGDEYYIRIGYKNSNNVWAAYAEDGNDIAVTVVAAANPPTSPTVTWINPLTSGTTIEQGKAYSLSASYDAGDDGKSPLVEYVVGGANSPLLQFSLGIAETNAWVAGQNDAASGGMHSGTSSVDFTVSTVKGDGTTPILTSADLPDGQSYVLRVGFQNSNNQWAGYSTGAHIPVTVVAPVLSTNDVKISKLQAFYSSTKDAVVINDNVSGNYAIFNVLGQSLKSGKIASEISVDTLKKGIYILTTEKGYLKFLKE